MSGATWPTCGVYCKLVVCGKQINDYVPVWDLVSPEGAR